MKSRRRKWWLMAAAIGVAFAIALVFLVDRAPPTPSNISSHSPESPESLVGVAPASPSAPVPVDSDSAWVLVDPNTVDELPPYKEVVPGRALVRTLAAIQNWEEGDPVVFGIPQLGTEFSGVIERTKQDTHGNRTHLGVVREDDGGSYRFIVTVGPRNTFAHIGTSKGTFELVVTGGSLGWLMPTRFMDQHVDYTQPDYYIVEERRPENDVPAK